ncbi:peroxiredoxin-like family protein [Colwellia sp. UCD-KL20]|uniref:peroxiredoxin-like family protein n=1 Tax=Colwellia sp. UCD-KL20 TaxID=1917165 RepID=UPI00097125AD|nr:peroxiredoxin-like family protein [Colwellia sp. UCD-KL20]
MTSKKLSAGQTFPALSIDKLDGGKLDFLNPKGDYDWLLVVVYRGKHCPLCTQYLSTLNELLPKFNELGVDVVAMSADPKEKALIQINEVKPNFEIGYDLSIEQMQTLGLYISNPRSEAETDRPFAEPGLFVINSSSEIQLIDISNAPFLRPELMSVIRGLGFIRNPENQYPIRGTLTY